MAKPFVKWAGGKSKLADKIISLIPEKIWKIPNLTYVEPFVGGGAVFFKAVEKQEFKKVILADANPHLINAWKNVKLNFDPLVTALKKLKDRYNTGPANEQAEMFRKLRDEFNTDAGTDLRRAALFLFLNKTCFNGLYRENKSGKFNSPFGYYDNPGIVDRLNLTWASTVLKNNHADLRCCNFSELVELPEPTTLIYCDPPYAPTSATSNFTSYTRHAFTHKDQTALRDWLRKQKRDGNYWITSNSDTPEIRDLYTGYHIHTIDNVRSIAASADSRGNKRELLITSW
jgi:DNA adenine methylase